MAIKIINDNHFASLIETINFCTFSKIFEVQPIEATYAECGMTHWNSETKFLHEKHLDFSTTHSTK